MTLKQRQLEQHDLDEQALRWRAEGLTYRLIGANLGTSAQQGMTRCFRAERRRRELCTKDAPPMRSFPLEFRAGVWFGLRETDRVRLWLWHYESPKMLQAALPHLSTCDISQLLAPMKGHE